MDKVMSNKNLIFFMTDQQRADSSGLAINNIKITPSWDFLSDNSISYNIAYDSCPLCVPSRTSLATGLNPLHTGMLLNDLPGKYAKDNKPIHEMLFDAGYEVAHIGVDHISLMPKLKDRISYSCWVDDESYAEYASGKGYDIHRSEDQCDYVMENCEGTYIRRPYSNAVVSIWDKPLHDFKDVWFADKAIEYIKSEHRKPFALFVCLWAPHPPLTVPQSYLDMFDMDGFSFPPNIGVPNKDEPASYEKGSPRQLAENVSADGWKDAWKAHFALTRLSDDQLGRILNAVEEAGIMNDTAIVCTTDHGEQLGQHGMYQKMEMYESAVRVPAIFHFPEIPIGRYNGPISHLDFVPTIVDYLLGKVEYPFDGISLLPFMEKSEEPPARDIFSIYNGNHQYGDTRRMVVRYPYKLIYDGRDIEFFDLSSDPFELDNLRSAESLQPLIDDMFTSLAGWGKRCGDAFVSYRRGEPNE